MKKYITFGLVILLIIIGFGLIVFVIIQNNYFGNWLKSAGTSKTESASSTEVKNEEENEIKVTPSYLSKLDGLTITEPEQEIWAVMVENFPDSRPFQKGLSKAPVIVEALAEGGITRYMAFFSHDFPEIIGPVRSARSYFLSWSEGFKPYYFHAGGSDEALVQLRKTPNLIAFDGLVYEGINYFVRDRKIAAPHNLFAVSADLLKIKESKDPKLAEWEFNLENDFWKFGETLAAGEQAENIFLDFSFPSYAIEYQYDQAAKNYLRKVGGQIHNDYLLKQEVRPTNIVVLITPYRALYDEKAHIEYQTVGEGKAYYFIGGKVGEGKWTRKAGEIWKLTDGDGAEMIFQPGQILIEILDSVERIKY